VLKPLVVTTLAMASLLACAPHRPSVTEPAQSCPVIPPSVEDYGLTETNVFENPEDGQSYRFSGPPHENVSVFVYPIGADVQSSGQDEQEWVNAEGAKFQQMFPIGVQRGWYDTFELAFAHPEPLSIAGREVPGFTAAAATRRGQNVTLELQYLYVICDRFVKVRGTLEAGRWAESTLPSFSKALAGRLAQQEGGPRHRQLPER